MELDKIYNEDCLVGMQNIPNHSIDAIICDLPYGTTSCAWDSVIPFAPLWQQYNRIAKQNAPIVLFGSEPFSTMLRMSNFDCWKYDWIWDKVSKQGFLNAKRRPLKQHEIISVFCFGKCVYYPQMVERGKQRNKGSYNKRKGDGDGVYGKFENIKSTNNIYYPSTILTFSNAVHKGTHPTQKPVELIRYLLRTYTNEGDVVLDNCIGSGTTAIACIKEKRHFIGFELNEEYFNAAQTRINNERQQQTIF